MTPGQLAKDVRKRNAFASPEQEAYLNLIRAAGQLTNRFDRLFKQHGVSQSGYNILRILRGKMAATEAHADGVRTQEIAEDLINPVPDVTRLIDRLIDTGFAQRHRCDQDRRVVRVQITPKGLDLLEQLDQPVLDLHHQTMGHMSKKDLILLTRLLEQVREANETE